MCVCVCVCARTRTLDRTVGSPRTVLGRGFRASPRGSQKKSKLGHLKDDEQTFFVKVYSVYFEIRKFEFGVSHARLKEEYMEWPEWWSN